MELRREIIVRKFISVFLALFLVWISLTGFNLQELILGAAVSLILAAIISPKTVYSFEGQDFGVLLRFIFQYMPLFFVKLFESNIQMAKIVLSPKMDIKPGFVKIHTDLKSDLSRFILANSITLTPGTVTMDLQDDTLLIHWVNVEGAREKEHYEAISGDFEKMLGRVFR